MVSLARSGALVFTFTALISGLSSLYQLSILLLSLNQEAYRNSRQRCVLMLTFFQPLRSSETKRKAKRLFWMFVYFLWTDSQSTFSAVLLTLYSFVIHARKRGAFCGHFRKTKWRDGAMAGAFFTRCQIHLTKRKRLGTRSPLRKRLYRFRVNASKPRCFRCGFKVMKPCRLETASV